MRSYALNFEIMKRTFFKMSFLLVLCFLKLSTVSNGQTTDCDNLRKPYFSYCNNSIVKDSECSSSSPKCYNYCENLRWTVENKKLGIVKFQLPTPPAACCFNRFDIIIHTLNDPECSDSSKIETHSKIQIFGKPCLNCTDKCVQDLDFAAKYLFTSCYEIHVKPVTRENLMLDSCVVRPFFIKTGYTKKLVGNSSMTIADDYDPFKNLLLTSINFDVPFGIYPDSALVKLNSGINLGLEDCTGTGKREACCSTGGKDNGDCCSQLYEKEKECSCAWKGNSLICQFENIQPGNYCLNVDLFDPRCDSNTFWAKIDDCSWYRSYSFHASEYEKVTITNEISSFWIVVIIVIISLIMAALIVVYFKAKKRVEEQQYRSFSPNKKATPLLATPKDPLRILLLYPRECEEFMYSMKVFRSILEEILFAQVYDIWDVKNTEDVNTLGPLWANKYIRDINFKIILVSSPCAKLIQQSIIQRTSLEYYKPKAEDSTYRSAMNCVLECLNVETNIYNRFFVIRLDSPFFDEDKLIVLNKCNTLPQHLKEFILEIHNKDTSEIVLNVEKLPQIQQLKCAVDKYRIFREKNTKYYMNLLDKS